MRALKVFLIVLVLASTMSLVGDVPATQPVSQTAVHDLEGVSVPDEHVAPSDVAKDAVKVIEAAETYFTGTKVGDSAAKQLGLLALISALLNLIVSVLKLTSSFWSNTRGKWILRLITITLGVIVAIVASLAAGMPWWDAVLLGLSGPGAVAMHEYQKLIPALSKKKKKKG